jgi:hypothetical protein
MTRSERGMIGKVQREMLEIGALPEEIDLVCLWVKRKFETVSVMAVPKWWSTALSEAAKQQSSTIEEVLQAWNQGE